MKTKTFAASSCAVLLCTIFLAAQNREVNWPTYAGDNQRSGWQRIETRITKDNVRNVQLLWKLKLDVQQKGPRPLLPPVILGRLISYRGFKELAFVGTNADIVYALDADLGKIFWTKHLEYASIEPQATGSSAACPGGLTAMPVMPAPAAAGRGARGGAGPFVTGPASLYAISSDGRIHRLNTSTGDDIAQPVAVLPPNARVSSLNMVENTIYAVTSQNCNDAPDAVWAIDLNGDAPKSVSFPLAGIGAGSSVGAVGADGTVYAASANLLYALTPRELKLRQSFSLPDANAVIGSSPVVFNYKNRDLVAVTGTDGRIYLLDSGRFSAGVGTEGGTPDSISTWEDAAGVRWVLVAISGRGSSAGSIASFKVEEQAGRAVLSPGWVSREMNSPVQPVIANGMVFALSTAGRAILYALDASTGKELYSSRNLVTGPASPTGITVTNGRAYFGGADGTFYAFGMYLEH